MPSTPDERRWTIYVCPNDKCPPAVKPGPCQCVKSNKRGHHGGIIRYESREKVEAQPASVVEELRERQLTPEELGRVFVNHTAECPQSSIIPDEHVRSCDCGADEIVAKLCALSSGERRYGDA